MANEARKQWFLDRIGKRVFRNMDKCDCAICAAIYEKGLVIVDRMMAQYLYDIETDFTADGAPLKYFDTKQEVTEFEKGLIDFESKISKDADTP